MPKQFKTGQRKTHELTVRLTPQERERLEQLRNEMSYSSLSRFLVETALAAPVSDTLAQAIGQCGEMLYELRELSEMPRSSITRCEIRRLIEGWENICHTLTMSHAIDRRDTR